MYTVFLGCILVNDLDQLLFKHNCKWEVNSFNTEALYHLRNRVRNHLLHFNLFVVLAVVTVIWVYFYPIYQKVLSYNSYYDSHHFFLPDQIFTVEVEDLLRVCGGNVAGHTGSANISLTRYCKERENRM